MYSVQRIQNIIVLSSKLCTGLIANEFYLTYWEWAEFKILKNIDAGITVNFSPLRVGVNPVVFLIFLSFLILTNKPIIILLLIHSYWYGMYVRLKGCIKKCIGWKFCRVKNESRVGKREL